MLLKRPTASGRNVQVSAVRILLNTGVPHDEGTLVPLLVVSGRAPAHKDVCRRSVTVFEGGAAVSGLGSPTRGSRARSNMPRPAARISGVRLSVDGIDQVAEPAPG